jgi:hypothetical protein
MPAAKTDRYDFDLTGMAVKIRLKTGKADQKAGQMKKKMEK